MIIIFQSIVPSEEYKKRERKAIKKRRPKKREKKREGTMLLSFFHTCASKQHHDLHDRESPMLSLSYTSGNFHYRTWLVYSNDGLPQMPQVFVSKQVGCTPTQFLLLSFHILIALVHPLHGNPYSLTLISIDGHLHSPLIRLVDVRLSSPFCLLHNHHSIPPIVLCPWLTLMYCVKIEKV